MSKKQDIKKTEATPAPKPRRTRKRYEINHRVNLIVHTEKLRDNLDLEQKVTGNDYTVIINRRLNESYERDPVQLKNS